MKDIFFLFFLSCYAKYNFLRAYTHVFIYFLCLYNIKIYYIENLNTLIIQISMLYNLHCYINPRNKNLFFIFKMCNFNANYTISYIFSMRRTFNYLFIKLIVFTILYKNKTSEQYKHPDVSLLYVKVNNL